MSILSSVVGGHIIWGPIIACCWQPYCAGTYCYCCLRPYCPETSCSLLSAILPWDLLSPIAGCHIALQLIVVCCWWPYCPETYCYLLRVAILCRNLLSIVAAGHISPGPIVVCCRRPYCPRTYRRLLLSPYCPGTYCLLMLVDILCRDLLSSVVGGHFVRGPIIVCCWWPYFQSYQL